MLATFLCAMLAIAAFCRAMEPDQIVAQIGDRGIRYREIRCDATWIAANLRARNESRSIESACREMEQARLKHILSTELLSRAETFAGLTISEAEIAEQELPIVRDEAELQKYLTFSQALPVAIARVRNGEAPSDVYTEAVAPLGIPRETFDAVSRVFDTKEKVAAYLAQDARQRMLTNLRQNARLAAVAVRLAADHRRTAEESGRPVAEVSAEFWANLIVATKTAVIAEPFRLPDPKEFP